MARKPPSNPGLEPQHFIREETQVEFEIEFKTPDKIEEMVDAFNRLIGLNEGGVLEDSLKRSISVAGSYADSPEGIEAGFDAANRAKGVLGEMGMKVGAIQARARANAIHFRQRAVYTPPEEEEIEPPWYEDFFDRVREGLLGLAPGADTLKRMRKIGGIASLAIGVLAILMFVKKMFEHSQILNTYSSAFMKIFGHFMDLIMIAFLPLLNNILIALITKVRPVVASFSEWLKDHPNIANIVFIAFLAMPFWGMIRGLLTAAITLAGSLVPWHLLFPQRGGSGYMGRLPRFRLPRWLRPRFRLPRFRLPRWRPPRWLRPRFRLPHWLRPRLRLPRVPLPRWRPFRHLSNFVSRAFPLLRRAKSLVSRIVLPIKKFGRQVHRQLKNIKSFIDKAVSHVRGIYRTKVAPRLAQLKNIALQVANESKKLYNNIKRGGITSLDLLNRQSQNLLKRIDKAAQIANRAIVKGLTIAKGIGSNITRTIREGLDYSRKGLAYVGGKGWSLAKPVIDYAARGAARLGIGGTTSRFANAGWTAKFKNAGKAGAQFAILIAAYEAYSLITNGAFTEANFRNWLISTGYLAALSLNTVFAGELVILGFTGIGALARSGPAQKSNQVLTDLIVGGDYWRKMDKRLTDGSIINLTKSYGGLYDEVYGYAEIGRKDGRLVPVRIDLTQRGQIALDTDPYDNVSVPVTYVIEDVGLVELQSIWNRLTDPNMQIDILRSLTSEASQYVLPAQNTIYGGLQAFQERFNYGRPRI